MASITSSGIGSGLDVQGLVQQLVAAEGQPTQIRIARKEAEFQSTLSALGSVRSAVTAFNDQVKKMQELDTLLQRSGTVGDDSVLGISVDSAALPGTYSVEVAQLAQVERLQSGAFTDVSTPVGSGDLQISVGGQSFTVTIDGSASTLSDIQDAINNAVDNKGVTATVVTADTGAYLFLTGEKTGSAQGITVTQSGGDGGLSVLEYDPLNALNSLTQTQEPQDAIVNINGFAVTSSGNSISGAIEGVTLDLLATNVDAAIDVTISNDKDAVKAQLDAFVNSYNELIDVFDEQTAYNTETESAAPLLGDATVRGLRDQLRREFFNEVSDIDATFNSLLDIGVTTGIDGKLDVDDSTIDTLLDTEFSKFGQLFANSDGYAVRFNNLIESYIDSTDGVLTERVEGIEASIEDLTDQRDALALRLESVEARLLRQFNALDALVGELTTTSSFLTQQLASLPQINTNRD